MPNKLDDKDEVLLKQVHPKFYEGGKLGSSAFTPNPEDDGMASSDRSSIVAAKDAHYHFTHHLKKQSACVFGVSVGEYGSESIDCIEDPLPAAGSVPANPAHCLSNFSAFSKNRQRVIAKKLKIYAEKRGIQHP